MKLRRWLAMLPWAPILVLGSGCSAPVEVDQNPSGDPTVFGLAPPLAKDLDPNADRVRVTLRASATTLEILPGHASTLQTYSGALPGPLIHAKRGDHLSVHFQNDLAEPSTLHFHGVRGENSMDGVPSATQPAVAPGDTFDYEFDLQDAGLFWYHPHHDSVAQLGSGLYGALLVDDPDEPADIGRQSVVVLSDVSLDADGNPLPFASDPQTILEGREGGVVLINGRPAQSLEVRSGERQRLRILNAARSRYFRLGLPGHSLLQIGSDGGQLEEPLSLSEALIVPGERLDLVIEPNGEVGTELGLLALPVSRGLPLAESATSTLLTLKFVAEGEPTPMPSLQRSLAALDPAGAEHVPIALTIDQSDGSLQMGINGVPFSLAEPVHARVGATQILSIENKSPYSHPFHLHGFFFQVLGDDQQPERPLALKDTLEIPPLSGRELVVSYDDRPGMWMFHCHVLDHAEAGMMGMLHVMP